MRDNRTYYDAFSERYEIGRDAGYHALVDALTVEFLLPYARGRDVLEVGCGTGLILKEVAGEARRAAGVDLSAGMLRRRTLECVLQAQADRGRGERGRHRQTGDAPGVTRAPPRTR